MKKCTFFIALFALALTTHAQIGYEPDDFSAVAPTGQTLYYRFANPEATQVYVSNGYGDNPKPSGHLVIPDTVYNSGNAYAVVGIGDYAFMGSDSLTSVVIPEGVTYIGEGAFYQLGSLWFLNEDGTIDRISKGLHSISIPSTVTSIGAMAFYECNTLGWILRWPASHIANAPLVIPSSVTTIGVEAFYNVHHVYYAGTATSYWGTNWGCSLLSKHYENGLYFADSTKTVLHGGDGTITDLIIPPSVTKVISGAFASDTVLTSLTIPATLQVCEEESFACPNLETVHFEAIPKYSNAIGYGPHYGKDYLYFYVFAPVNYMGDSASIRTITIDEGTRYIPPYFMNGCSTLTTVNLPSVIDSIYENAFNGTAISSITLSDSLKYIGRNAFRGAAFTSLTIPQGVKYIGKGAFVCPNLTYLEYNALDAITETLIPRSSASAQTGWTTVFADKPHWEHGEGPEPNVEFAPIASAVIGEGITRIPDHLLSHISTLHRLSLPSTLDTIGDCAFYGNGFGRLEDDTITIPSDVKYIGISAFTQCGGSGFYFSHPRVTLNYNAKRAEYETERGIGSYGYNYFYYDGDGRHQPHGYHDYHDYAGDDYYASPFPKYIGHLNIGDSVRYIPNSFVYGAAFLDSIVLPYGVDTIETGAFICAGMFRQDTMPMDVILPQGIKYVGSGAFHSVPMAELTIPEGVEYIGSLAFASPTLVSLTYNAREAVVGTSVNNYVDWLELTTPFSRVKVPTVYWYDSVISVLEGGNISELTIGSSVRTIQDYIFVSQSFSEVILPDSLQSIGVLSFGHCPNIRRLVIPNQVTSIGYSAFNKSRINHLTIGSGVQSITASAFASMVEGDTIVSMAVTPPSIQPYENFWNGESMIESGTFRSTSITLFVPCQSVDEYRIASGWMLFDTILCVNTYTLTASSSDSTMGTVLGEGTYEEGCTATLTAIPYEGHHFVQWHDGNTDNPRMVVVVSDTTFTATFEANAPDTVYYTVTVASSDTAMGTVTGGGVYADGATATLTAIPAPCHQFSGWGDGVADNPRSLTVNADTTITAIFAPIAAAAGEVAATACDSYTWNGQTYTASGTYTFATSTVAGCDSIATLSLTLNYSVADTLEATATESYDWNGQTYTESGAYTYSGTTVHGCDSTVTLLLTIEPPVVYYTVTVASSDDAMGSVLGGGTYEAGTEVTLTATPAEGHEFVQWNDGLADNPRTLVLTSDTTFVAQFQPEVGIQHPTSDLRPAIHPNPACSTVTLSGLEPGAKVTIVDLNGREVLSLTTDNGTLTTDVSSLTSGAYFVRVTGERQTAVRKLIVK